MKKLRLSAALLFVIILAAGSIPLVYSIAEKNDFVNSDSECMYNDLCYYAGGMDTGLAYSETVSFENRTYYTDYDVTQIAVYDDILYVSENSSIHRIDIETKNDETYITAEGNIDRFAVVSDGVYYLSNGKISFLDNKEDTAEYIIGAGGIQKFWLEDSETLSYMLDEEYVHTLDISSGKETVSEDNSSSFGKYIPITSETYVNGHLNTSNGTISDLRSKFPAGKYWNHVGSSTNNANGYTSSPCTHHGSGCSYGGSCGCNSYASCIQCMGYAYKCGYDVYNQDPHNWDKKTASSYVNDVKAGDVIRYRNDGHSIFVIGVSGDTIYFTDCNSDGHCIIRWNGTVSKSTVKASFTRINIAPSTAPGGIIDVDDDEDDPDDPGEVTKEKFTITFNANGGVTTATSREVYKDTAVGDLPEATREGYSFGGWYTEINGGTKFNSSDILTNDITLYAHWDIDKFTIDFDTNGKNCTKPSSITKEYGKPVTLPSLSLKGYSFLGWNTMQDGSGNFYAGGSVYSANESATLFAVWEGNTYTVTLKPQGGSIKDENAEDITSYTVMVGNTYGDIPEPVRENYDFAGWYYNTKSTGIKVTSDTIVPAKASDNMFLYASWTEKVYHITYELLGGTSTVISQDKKIDRNINITTAIPTRKYYTFSHWIDSDGKVFIPGETYTENADLLLYAIWIPDEYTVKYDANGGTNAPESQIKQHDIDLLLTGNSPDRTGYNLVSWNTDKYGKGKTYEINSMYTDNASITLYAQWEVQKFKTTYDTNGSTDVINTQTRNYGQTFYITDAEPERAGYIFVGWYNDGYDEEHRYYKNTPYMLNADLNLTAQWEAEIYTVTYNGNGADSSVPDSQDKTYGQTVVISKDNPKKTGYTFTGWNTSKDGTGTAYASGSTYSDNTSITLYAQWKANNYVITFIPNGASENTTKATFTYDSTYSDLPVLSRIGYTFGGWFNGSTVIQNGDTVKITADTPFYAIWTPKKYTVSFDTQCEGVTANSITVTYDSTYGTLPSPSRSGYTFTGWFTETTGGKEIESSSTVRITANDTLYARWVRNPTADTAVYVVDGVKYTEQSYTDVNSIVNPAVPKKAGYRYSWNSPVSCGDGVIIYATRTAIYYNAYFKAEGKDVATITFTIDDEYLIPPAMPIKNGYTGKWESFELKPSDITVNATYNANTYTVTFTADGRTLSKQSYVYESGTVTAPEIPEKEGYTSSWPDYTLPYYDSTVEAVYTPIKYIAMFVADGTVIKEVEFTVEDTSIKAPYVPHKAYLSGQWESYTIVPANIVINAVYTYKGNISIMGYREEVGTYEYGTSVTFHTKETIPDGYEAHWFINGEDKGTGEDSENGKTYTCEDMKSNTTVQVKLYKKGSDTAEKSSEIETVKINTGFFSKLVSFFKKLFKKSDTVDQIR